MIERNRSDRQWKDLVFLTAAILIVTMWYSGIGFLLLQQSRIFVIDTPDKIHVEVITPSYVFYNENTDLEVTVENKSNKKSDPIYVLLTYKGELPIVSDDGESLLISFGELENGERKTNRINFIVRSVQSVTQLNQQLVSLQFTPTVNSGASIFTNQIQLETQLIPIEAFRTLMKAAGSFLGIAAAWLVKQWWDYRTNQNISSHEDNS